MEPTTPTVSNPKDDLRAMRIFCFALMGGLAAFSLISLLVIKPGNAAFKGISDYFPMILVIAVAIAGICVVIGMKLYNKKLRDTVSQAISLREKLNQYRSALILFMACCEMPALLAIIGFFLTGNYLLLIVPGLMLILMASRLPTAQKLTVLLGLDMNEQQQLV